jgi:hypothetical protein
VTREVPNEKGTKSVLAYTAKYADDGRELMCQLDPANWDSKFPKPFCSFGILDVKFAPKLKCPDHFFWTQAWACGKGWLWTLSSITWACHTLPFYALRPFQGRHSHRAGDLLPSSTLLDTPRRTPMDAGEGISDQLHDCRESLTVGLQNQLEVRSRG